MYLLDGEVATDPVRAVVPETGIALPKPRRTGSPNPFRVRILHFNDLHGHLVRIRPSGTEPVFSRIAGAIRVTRERALHDPNSAVLVLSAGDDLAGSLFDEVLSTPGSYPGPHPAYCLYSAAGVHGSVLGNHDLDRGSHALAGAMGRFLGQATVTLSGGAALSDARLLHVADLSADATFEAEVMQPLLAQIGPYLRRTLGPVVGHADLGAEAVQNDLSSGESALANFIAGAIVLRCRAAGYEVDLAMIDASVVHDGLPVGTTLTVADWFNVMPYPDTLRLCRLQGRQLAALIQDNAYRVDRPDEPHTERGFLHFS